MELYIHIPFCIKKCLYCDFLSFTSDEASKRAYVVALCEEIRQKSIWCSGQEVTSIFIGGGTPTTLGIDSLELIMSAIKTFYTLAANAEISIECNPGSMFSDLNTTPYSYFTGLKKMGINRLSIGLQSTDDELLSVLGRIHTYDDFVTTYKAARLSGFDNINIDLISSIPGQSVDAYCDTLKKICELAPEHISAYSLIIEEGTPYYTMYHHDDEIRAAGGAPSFLPSEEEERKMYDLTREILLDNGYDRYEISNYAKPGMHCQHNVGYWTGVEYLGFGLGAASYIKTSANLNSENASYGHHERFCNTRDFSAYLSGDFEKKELQQLSKNDEMSEFVFLGLRLTAGISKSEFVKEFGSPIDDIWPGVIDKLTDQGLIACDGDYIYLTPLGLDVSNMVFAEFV